MNEEKGTSLEKKMGLTMADDQGRETLDLIRLADVFRRADKSIFEDSHLADLFNKKAEELGRAASTYETGGNPDKALKRILRQLVMLASDNGIKRVILPIGHEKESAKHLRDDIMYGDNFARFYNIQIDFQTEVYKSPAGITRLGKPREEPTGTAFDFGLVLE